MPAKQCQIKILVSCLAKQAVAPNPEATADRICEIANTFRLKSLYRLAIILKIRQWRTFKSVL